jgi:hypothetical protein
MDHLMMDISWDLYLLRVFQRTVDNWVNIDLLLK